MCAIPTGNHDQLQVLLEFIKTVFASGTHLKILKLYSLDDGHVGHTQVLEKCKTYHVCCELYGGQRGVSYGRCVLSCCGLVVL